MSEHPFLCPTRLAVPNTTGNLEIAEYDEGDERGQLSMR